MKRVYAKSQYAKPYERYCREVYPSEAERICRRAEEYYRGFRAEMPDLGKNMMAKNMLDWEVLLTVKRRMTERVKFLGKWVDGNRQRWPYRLFERIYVRYGKQQRAHFARGEWTDSWRVEINPDHRTEGFSFRLVGCPIARHAREHGYGELLPYLCKTDHDLAAVMHTRLIRMQTEALGGSYCDYWYVGDQSPVAETYRDLEKI